MTHRRDAAPPPGEYLAALRASCSPWYSRAKNVRVCKIRRNRFILAQNGQYGKARPRQVFYGAVSPESGGGSSIKGRFGLSPGDRLFLAVLIFLIALLCVGGTWAMEITAKIFICSSGLFCCGILVAFSSLVAQFSGSETRKELLAFMADPHAGC